MLSSRRAARRWGYPVEESPWLATNSFEHFRKPANFIVCVWKYLFQFWILLVRHKEMYREFRDRNMTATRTTVHNGVCVFQQHTPFRSITQVYAFSVKRSTQLRPDITVGVYATYSNLPLHVVQYFQYSV